MSSKLGTSEGGICPSNIDPVCKRMRETSQGKMSRIGGKQCSATSPSMPTKLQQTAEPTCTLNQLVQFTVPHLCRARRQPGSPGEATSNQARKQKLCPTIQKPTIRENHGMSYVRGQGRTRSALRRFMRQSLAVGSSSSRLLGVSGSRAACGNTGALTLEKRRFCLQMVGQPLCTDLLWFR